MNKKIYMMAIVTATVICALFGIIKHNENSGFRLDGKTIFQGDAENARKNSQKVSIEKFSSIKVDSKVLDVHILTGNEVEVSFNCTEGLEPDIKVEDGKLIVKQQDKRKTKHGSSSAEVFITIPEKIDISEAIVKTDVGDIKVDSVSIKKTKLSTDVGDVKVEDSEIKDAEINTNVGDVKVKNCVTAELTIDTDTGDINIEDSEFDKLKGSSDVGDIEVESKNSISDYDIELKTSVGDVVYQGEKYRKQFEKEGKKDYKIVLHGSIGDVKLED